MKTTLKKTMAALSAAAVVAASAAVMAIPTSAAGMSLTIGSATLTESELKAANYEVTLPIGSTAEFNSVGVGVTLGEGLSYVEDGMETTAKGASGLAVESNGFVFMPFSYASVPLKTLKPGQFAQITVKVTDAAKAGDVFNLTIAGKDSDGTVMEYKNGVTGETGEAGSGAGTITIVADATDAPTEAPTTAPVATGTTAATTTTKKAAAAMSTSSPRTGDALPVAGVAVAVAVIGGVALVAKKRK